ncbi:MAG: hypothetical protein KJ709_07330 [Nanoarchaeota archaeon]|nr:hypothetical protein [Nanoarchaeota archaeon]
MRIALLAVLICVLPCAVALEESAELSFTPSQAAVFTPESFDMPFSEIRILAEYSGEASVRATTAPSEPVDDILYSYLTIRSGVEQYDHSLKVQLRVNHDFMRENNLDEHNIAVLQLDRTWKPIKSDFIVYQGSYYYYNITPDFGTIAVVGRPKHEVRLGSFKSEVGPGRTVSIPVRFSNMGERNITYALSIQSSEEFADFSFDEQRITVPAGGSRQVMADVMVHEGTQPSIYSAALFINSNTKSWSFPLAIEVTSQVAGEEPLVSLENSPESIGPEGSQVMLRLDNPMEISQRLIVSVLDGWADVSITPGNLILLGPGESEEVKIGIIPRESGQKELTVKVTAQGEDIFEEVLTFKTEGKKRPLPLMYIIMIIIGLIVAVILMRLILRPPKQEVRIRSIRGGHVEEEDNNR